jgi:hypothetical protein
MQLHSTKLNYQPQSLLPFFILVIGYEFVHFDPQLINKLPISLIPPPDLINSNPCFHIPFFGLVFGFGFLQ